MNIGITNESLMQTDTDYFYHVHMFSNANRTIHIDILNNTFHKVHFHLDNSRMSAHINNNTFTEAGITILSTSYNSQQPVILENNAFQGQKADTILQVQNTSNILIAANIFQNSQLSFRHMVDDIANVGVLIHNSHVQMYGCLFKNVSFFPVLKFENCSFVSNALTMTENNLSAFQADREAPERYSLVHIKHSEGTMESIKFVSNLNLYCFLVTGGNIIFMNMIAAGNSEVQVGRAWAAALTIENATIANNSGGIFYIDSSVTSIRSCVFEHNSATYRFRNNNLFVFRQANIKESEFEDNNGLIRGPSHNSSITGCHFRYNHYVYGLIFVNVQWLQILSSIFESNDGLGEVISVSEGYVVINGSKFSHNRNVVEVTRGSIEFTNCLFNTNYALYRGVVSVQRGFMRLTNCSFRNNTAVRDAGVLFAIESQLFFLKCIATNNSASSEAGAISVIQDSTLLVENSTFANNSCGVEGGAIRAHRNASLTIFHTIFLGNKALGADGGAIFLEDESKLISGSCQFIGNTAALGGGAVMVIDHSSYSDTESNFTHNTAADNGKFKCYIFNCV